jgi:uncharacterized protein involved in outer membrane biogenesis
MLRFLFRLIGRSFGFVLKAAALLAALIAIIAGVIYASFDSEQYKQRLTKRVVDLTGRVLTIDGDATLELTLPPRIVLQDVRLKNARWARRPDMLRARQVEITLNPLSAISGGNTVSQIRLDGADVAFETSATGDGNWVAFVTGASAQGLVSALGTLGIWTSSQQPAPPIVFYDATFTTIDGGTGISVTIPIGGVGVGGGPGSLVVCP